MVVQMINAVFTVLQLAILARVLLSWVDQNPYPDSQAKEFLWTITEPILEPLRRYVPPLGMFDITPIVALVLLSVIQEVLVTIIAG